MSKELDDEYAWQLKCALAGRPPTRIGAAAILAAAKLTPEFLVSGRIPNGAITFLVGPPGASKSWLGYALALTVAQGQGAWLGLEAPGAPRNVLLLNYDNPTPELGRRMLRLAARPDDPIFAHTAIPGSELWRLPEQAEDLLALVTVTRPALILVDSLRQAHTADENSSGEMAKIMSHFKAWAALGAAVVIVHHSNKSEIASGTNAVRGSVEIVASADAVVEVTLPSSDGWAETRWSKHRSWALPQDNETLTFHVQDYGELTRVERKNSSVKKQR